MHRFLIESAGRRLELVYADATDLELGLNYLAQLVAVGGLGEALDHMQKTAADFAERGLVVEEKPPPTHWPA